MILFARNVRSAGQVRAAMRSLQAIRRPRGLRAPLHRHGRPGGRAGAAHPRRARARRRERHARAAQARADGRAAARTLRSAGANMDLAPVADVGAPGRGAAARAAHVRALVERRRARAPARSPAACARGGVRATAKHFPGFGAAAVNTDNARAADRHVAGHAAQRRRARRSRASSTTASTRSCSRPPSIRRSTSCPPRSRGGGSTASCASAWASAA